jgi:hypothetical protein
MGMTRLSGRLPGNRIPRLCYALWLLVACSTDPVERNIAAIITGGSRTGEDGDQYGQGHRDGAADPRF